MVNKNLFERSRRRYMGGSKTGGVKKEFWLNVGFILSGNNGGKPYFYLNFYHFMIKSINYTF